MKRRDMLKIAACASMAGYFPASATHAQTTQQTYGWQNWSGLQKVNPRHNLTPATIDELRATIMQADTIRVAGAGHSFSPLVPTQDSLISLAGFQGIYELDAEQQKAWVGAGAWLYALAEDLETQGFAFRNMSDINVQSLAGAISTATHGTGMNFPCLSAEITGAEIMTAQGDVFYADADMLPALRVSLGALGILTKLQIQLVPRYHLHRRVWVQRVDNVLKDAETLWRTHRNFEFFYIPFSDYCICITHDATDLPVTPQAPHEDDEGLFDLKALRDYLSWFPSLRRFLLAQAIEAVPEENVVGESWRLLSTQRTIPFNEMEYHIPAKSGLEAFEAVYHHIETHRPDAFFPMEIRYTKADDAWLSPFYESDCISVAVHRMADENHDYFYSEIEPIFLRYGGRPHWGKLHSLVFRDLVDLYPEFERFTELRTRLDPQGKFLNPHLKDLFLP